MNSMDRPWRIGRSLGRTIYAVDEASEDRKADEYLGMMDDRAIAAHIVETHNAELNTRRTSTR